MIFGTYFTFWHYIALLIGVVLFVLGVMVSFKEKKSSVRNSMIFSVFLVSTLVIAFSMMAIDKYTKIVKLSDIKNRRILSNETIVFTGYVENVGNYTIGQVEVEVKLVNKGHVTGNVKAGSFYKPSGFFDFFSSSENKRENRPQKQIVKYVVSTELKAGKSEFFRVSMPYPPYFKHVSFFTSATAH